MEVILQEAVELIQMGQCEEALMQLQFVSPELLPESVQAEYFFWKSMALMGLKELEEAEQVLRSGISQFRDDGRFYRSLAQLLSDSGREEESLVYFAKAAELMPDDCVTVYERAYALYKLERDDEAIAHFQELLELNPECSTAVQFIGEILCARGEQEKAFEVYGRYLQKVKDDPVVLVETAICLSDLRRFHEAFDYYRQAAEVQPEDVYAYYNWAVSLWRFGHLEEAREKIVESLEYDDCFPLAWMLLGRLQIALGDAEAATESLQRSIKLAREREEDNLENLSWCFEGFFEGMVELGRFVAAEATFWEAARANLLSETMLEGYNRLNSQQRTGLSRWWIQVNVRLYKSIPVQELSGQTAAGYHCCFDVLAKDPDEAVDFATDFERHLGEGEVLVERCLVREEGITGVPGILWVHPDRRYYSNQQEASA